MGFTSSWRSRLYPSRIFKTEHKAGLGANVNSKPCKLGGMICSLPLIQIEDYSVFGNLPISANSESWDCPTVKQIIGCITANAQDFPEIRYGNKITVLL